MKKIRKKNKDRHNTPSIKEGHKKKKQMFKFFVGENVLTEL